MDVADFLQQPSSRLPPSRAAPQPISTEDLAAGPAAPMSDER